MCIYKQKTTLNSLRQSCAETVLLNNPLSRSRTSRDACVTPTSVILKMACCGSCLCCQCCCREGEPRTPEELVGFMFTEFRVIVSYKGKKNPPAFPQCFAVNMLTVCLCCTVLASRDTTRGSTLCFHFHSTQRNQILAFHLTWMMLNVWSDQCVWL